MSTDIRMEIAMNRQKRIDSEGPAQGQTLPEQREAPVVPFGRDPFVICEVKRRSPSKGDINASLDPVEQAGRYADGGIRSVSVLTEQDYFNGSLDDLMRVKKAYPDLAVLRKDFLLSVEDVEISHRAGADAFLLIASLLETDLMQQMHERGTELGLTPLVELHDEEDVAKARTFKPKLVGINSRNLKTFQIDPLRPLKVRALIDWDCDVIYESGISSAEDARFARGTGFAGILVGEAVVRDPELIPRLAAVYAPRALRQAQGPTGAAQGPMGEAQESISGTQNKEQTSPSTEPAAPVAEPVEAPEFIYGAWKKLYDRYSFKRPLVKVCGITRKNDAELAIEAGADMIGFILAESPRKVDGDFVRYLKNKPVLKVGVVVLKEGEQLPEEIRELLEDGSLDFIQYHGHESAETTLQTPGYKALRLKDVADAGQLNDFPQPAVLIDAFSKEAYGGTGKRIDDDIIAAAAEKKPLWLAGGITPENVFEILEQHRPDLIDISSGLESEPGKKDADKIERFFKEIKRYENL